MKNVFLTILLTSLAGFALAGFTFSAAAGEPDPGSVSGREIFGIGGGFIHPSLALGGAYSDNIYNTRKDEKDDFIWVVSPEIWFSLPGSRVKAMNLSVSPKTPAGFTLSRENPAAFRRYRAYLGAGADFYRYSEFTEEDTESYKLEGLFQYNFRSGFSIELIDQYVDTFDPVGVAPFTRRDEYMENLFNVTFSYALTEKFKLRFDYTRIDLDYDERPDDEIPLIGRDRQDNGYSGYLFYKMRPKMSVFAQYQFIDIDYDLDVLAGDSEEHQYFGGILWDMTAKSRGRLKAGYGVKKFTDVGFKEGKNFILEGEIHHHFTPKTSLGLVGYRRTDETTIQETEYVVTHGISANYKQRFTAKLTGHLFATYARDHYQGEFTFDGETKERKDDLVRIRPSLRYEFSRWLLVDASYRYSQRDSNFSSFDFTENRFSIRVSFSLYNRRSKITGN
ncbi:MAG: hypothetical protein DSY89_04245 [Deltaproteobacteria bacterium]|nr:MAG: hypothetical protein DSY89_04245 [Deltaproteobacteria bacterium]